MSNAEQYLAGNAVRGCTDHHFPKIRGRGETRQTPSTRGEDQCQLCRENLSNKYLLCKKSLSNNYLFFKKTVGNKCKLCKQGLPYYRQS
jgi:hypothetical protein